MKAKPTRRTNKPRAEVREHSLHDMAGFLLENFPQLNEAFTRADIELALDDRGWLVPGRQWTAADLDAQTRTTLVAKARLYWLRDPLMKQAVRLWTDYALGTGISWDSKQPKIKKALNEFCYHKRNTTIMDSEGQRRSSKKLLIDGEVFFSLYDSYGNEPKTIRRIDPLQITDLICDPDDEEHVLGYRRLTATDKILYYADYRCDDDDLEMLSQQDDPSSKGKIGNKVEQGVQLYHAPWDTLLKRGNGLLFPTLDWSKEHRRFMEARVAITQALAKFAWKGKVKGGQSILNAIQKKLESTYAQAGMTMVERHPQVAPGGTWLENAGIDLEPMPRVTGGREAKDDGDQLKLMVCAGTGVMLHYFGDPSTGNLATATAMELPMLKMFLSYQAFWTDAYTRLFGIALDRDDLMNEGLLSVVLPPILQDDLRKLGQFVKFVADIFPEIRVPEVLRVLLTSANVPNIDDVMDAAENARGELEVQNQAQQDHQLKLAAMSKYGPDMIATPSRKNGKDPNVNKTGGARDPKGRLAQQSAGIPSNPESGYGTTEAAAMVRLAEALESLNK